MGQRTFTPRLAGYSILRTACITRPLKTDFAYNSLLLYLYVDKGERIPVRYDVLTFSEVPIVEKNGYERDMYFCNLSTGVV